MIRNLLVAVLFFFGPAVLMFILRNMFLFLRLWVQARRMRNQPEVIDVTPRPHEKPSLLFILAAIAVGAICAVWAWSEMNEEPVGKQTYIPAHIDKQGKVIPGRVATEEKENRPAQAPSGR